MKEESYLINSARGPAAYSESGNDLRAPIQKIITKKTT